MNDYLVFWSPQLVVPAKAGKTGEGHFFKIVEIALVLKTSATAKVKINRSSSVTSFYQDKVKIERLITRYQCLDLSERFALLTNHSVTQSANHNKGKPQYQFSQ